MAVYEDALRILFLSDAYPWPLDNGAIQRVYYLLRDLAGHHTVTLLAQRRGGLSAAERAPLDDLGVRIVLADNSDVLDRPEGPYGFWRPLHEQIMNAVWPPSDGLPVTVRRWWSHGLFAMLRDLRQTESYDLVWAQRAALGEMARQAGWPTVLVDMPDLDTEGAGRALATLGRYVTRPLHEIALRRVEAYERALPTRFAHVIVVKPEDRVFMRSRANVTVVPNGAVIQPPVDAAASHAHEMLFVGSMGYSPNIDAALYFAADILPRILQQQPAAQFSVVGKETAEEVRRLHDGRSIVVHGAVPAVMPYYAAAGLVVAPIRLGAGTRLKVLEALMFGKAVVATPMAIEGLDVRAGIDLEVADTPEAFAAACVALMQDEARRLRLGQAGRQRVVDRYDWTNIGRLATAAVEQTARAGAAAPASDRPVLAPVAR
jgi:glycosyltransferase involved in cell wall biosynthesis